MAQVTGGSGPYQYDWKLLHNGAVIDQLSRENDYPYLTYIVDEQVFGNGLQVTVTDLHGATATSTIQLTRFSSAWPSDGCQEVW
jgi:hypothetical protein